MKFERNCKTILNKRFTKTLIELMTRYLHANTTNIKSIIHINNAIKENNPNNVFVQYKKIFETLLSQQPKETIDCMIHNFSKTIPTIIYSDVCKYYKKMTGTNFIKSKASDAVKLDFVAYTLIIEIKSDDYFKRICLFLLHDDSLIPDPLSVNTNSSDDDMVEAPPNCPSHNKRPKKCKTKSDYLKQSLLFHPDKNTGCIKNATKKFQKLKELCPSTTIYTTNNSSPKKSKTRRACKYGERTANGKCPRKPKTKRVCKYGERTANGKCPKKQKK